MHDVISSTDKKTKKACFKLFVSSTKWGNPTGHRLLSGNALVTNTVRIGNQRFRSR